MEYYHSEICPIEIVKTEKLNITFQRHNHVEHYVISIVEAGHVEVRYDKGDTRTYAPGEVFCVKPLQTHAVRMERDAVMVSVCIGRQLFAEYAYDMLAHMVWEMTARADIPTLSQTGWIKILRNLEGSAGEQDTGTEPAFEKIMKLLAVFPERELSLEQMAEELHMSKYHFLRKFRERAGLPPHRFCLQCRIRKAQKRLRAKHSIIELALEMGFYDQSHFDHCFKSIVGISPKAYIAAKKIISGTGADGAGR